MDPSSSIRPEASTVHRAASTGGGMTNGPQEDSRPETPAETPLPQPLHELEGAETVIRQGFFDDMMSGGSSRHIDSRDTNSPDGNRGGSSHSQAGADSRPGSRSGAGGSQADRATGMGMHQTPASLTRDLQGQRLNHFELLEQIGGGGMGAVFRARDERLGRIVAVKVVPFAAGDPDLQRRFRNEAQSAAKLDHPLIARVFEVGNDGPWYYIVFEYIDGSNIRDIVTQDGPLSLDDAVYYTCQVAEAIGHASRRGIVHRDIKPSNVVVTDDSSIKLVDMGLARSESFDTSEDLTASGVTLGTFDYISPEQAHDPRLADIRSDLYSLGCTFYFMLTGSPPFPGGTMLQKLLNHGNATIPDIRDHRPGTSEDLNAILQKMLAKQPDQRYQDSHVLIADLRELAMREDLPRSRGVNAVAIETDRVSFPSARKHLPWIVAASLLLFSVFGLELIAWQKRSDFRSILAKIPNTAMESPPVAALTSGSTPTSDSSSDLLNSQKNETTLRFPPPQSTPRDWIFGPSSSGADDEFQASPQETDGSPSTRNSNRINGEATSSAMSADASVSTLPDGPNPSLTPGVGGPILMSGSTGTDATMTGPIGSLPADPADRDSTNSGLTPADPPALIALPGTSRSSLNNGTSLNTGTGLNTGIGSPNSDALAGDRRPSGAPRRLPSDPPSLSGFPFPIDSSPSRSIIGSSPGTLPPAPGLLPNSRNSTDDNSANSAVAAMLRGDTSRTASPDPGKTRSTERSDTSQVPPPLNEANGSTVFLPAGVEPRLIRVLPIEALRDPATQRQAQSNQDALVTTLQDAVELARRTDLERIEIDTPILYSTPVVIEQDDLIITSSAPGGTAIIFRSNEKADMQRSDMLKIGSNRIELVDLHCYWTVPVTETDGGSMIALSANRQVLLTDCSITIDNPSRRDEIFAFNVKTEPSRSVRSIGAFGDTGGFGESAMAALNSESDPLPLVSIELYNVVVRGQISMLRMDVAAELQLLWENGLLAVSGRMIETGGSIKRQQPKSGSIRLSLQRLTSYTPQGLLRMRLGGAAPYPVEIERRAEESVFVVDPGVPHVEITGTLPQERENNWLRIRGASNAYETDTTLSDPLLVVRDEFGQTRTVTMNDLVTNEPSWADDRTPRWVVRWSDPLPESIPTSQMIPADFRQDGSLFAGFQERNLPKMPMQRTFDIPPSE
ncbi:serine/threonine protein kinase [Neorhodopirellula lusitana]|uniref:Serine/threonine protein kinase n=1 Tax=Neorhodopirellula lusitana TaxID=445327 RepID=A0ABY1PUM9_9BACT|nr:serine/threonine protein kinase [Neorhodopirellula lusitana]SMP48884.1 serine/threonine protein kinase [Neorhodopirellula lusitana]